MRTDDPAVKNVIRKIEEAGQEHLLQFWDDLGQGERKLLLKDIASVDFSVLDRFKSLVGGENRTLGEVKIPDVVPVPASPEQKRNEMQALEAGESLLRDSKAAIFTAAGGQSSRLGIDAPKGTYPVTPVRRKSLFQVFAEKIRALSNRYGVQFPWVLMVSDTNREQTERFFADHGFFGLPRSSVRFIEQGMFPAVDASGNILLREKHRLFLSPSGHGGTFTALRDSGALAWLSGLGVEEIFYFQVDNVLAGILDPVFIGYHVLGRCQMSSKAVRKKAPDEKLGVFALLDGKPGIVEYSELSLIESALGKGSAARFDAGNIAIHVLNLAFCDERSAGGNTIPLHLALKAIPRIGPDGRAVEPGRPNGYKFETFIFDALGYTGRSVIMEVRREEEFSPLKNKTGDDSPETVLRDQVLLFAGWLESAGFWVPRDAAGAPRHRIEVSPLFALDPSEFAAAAAAKKPGERLVQKDTYYE